MYQNVAEGKIMFHDEKLSKTREDYYLPISNLECIPP